MTDTEMYIGIAIAIVIAGALAYVFSIQRKQAKQALKISNPDGGNSYHAAEIAGL